MAEAAPEAQLVMEPHLSMEVQDQLKRRLSELEVEHAAEGSSSQPAELGAAFVGSAVSEMVQMLRQFDPEVSKEALSDKVHGIVHSDTFAGHLGVEARLALREHLPVDRRQWFAADIEGHNARMQAGLNGFVAGASKAALGLKMRSVQLARAPATRAVVLSAGGGSLVLGVTGGVAGVWGGAASGALVGVVPSLLTFGLSVPAGALVGGSVGGCFGTAAGVVSGAVGGGVVGAAGYRYRVEIKDGVLYVKVKAKRAVHGVRARALETTSAAKAKVVGTAQAVQAKGEALVSCAKDRAHAAAQQAKEKASQLTDKAKAIVKDPATQATAASAAGGAAAVGAGGGAFGFAAGGALGAVCGLGPAVFTFGLSIPVGAAIGGGAGACMGVATGGTAGLIGGGAAGYGIYARRQQIGDGAADAWERVHSVAESVKETANSSACYVKARLCGTGGTQ